MYNHVALQSWLWQLPCQLWHANSCVQIFSFQVKVWEAGAVVDYEQFVQTTASLLSCGQDQVLQPPEFEPFAQCSEHPLEVMLTNNWILFRNKDVSMIGELGRIFYARESFRYLVWKPASLISRNTEDADFIQLQQLLVNVAGESYLYVCASSCSIHSTCIVCHVEYFMLHCYIHTSCYIVSASSMQLHWKVTWLYIPCHSDYAPNHVGSTWHLTFGCSY